MLEDKKIIAVFLQKLFVDGFITAFSNPKRGKNSQITGENTKYNIQRVK